MADPLRRELREAFDRLTGPPEPEFETRVRAGLMDRAAAGKRTRRGWVRELGLAAIVLTVGVLAFTILVSRHSGLNAPSPSPSSEVTAPASSAQVSPGRTAASLAYDPARQVLVLFGGGYLNDTWTWDGSNWTLLHPATSPPPRAWASMASDGRGRLVLFGGSAASGDVLGDTWTWNGTSWQQERPASSPPARTAASMVYDTERRTVVLFGGETRQGRISIPLNDTWTWDGTTWSQAHPAVLPPPRLGASLTYDGARKTVLLFGGGAGFQLNDTWTWDGTIWRLQHPGTSPPPRVYPTMAYDETAGAVVLFGGADGVARSDSWTWDGQTWTEQHPDRVPPGGSNLSMAYDAARQSLLLYTVSGNRSEGLTSETWKWTGITWKHEG